MICCATRCWQWGYLNHIKPSFIYIYIHVYCVSWKSINKCLDASWGCVCPHSGCTLLCVRLATAGMMSVCSSKHLCAYAPRAYPMYNTRSVCICMCMFPFSWVQKIHCLDLFFAQGLLGCTIFSVKAGGVARPSSITTEGESQIGGDWLLWTYMYMHTGCTCTLNCLQWYDCIRRFRTCRLRLHRTGILCCRGWNRCTYTCLERVRHL